MQPNNRHSTFQETSEILKRFLEQKCDQKLTDCTSRRRIRFLIKSTCIDSAQTVVIVKGRHYTTLLLAHNQGHAKGEGVRVSLQLLVKALRLRSTHIGS